MSTARTGDVQTLPGWGDRTELYPKRMLYLLSLHATAAAQGATLRVAPAGQLRHLLGDTAVTTPDGVRCDLPVAEVIGGEGEIGTRSEPASARLRLRISATIGTAGLLVDCLGVVNFDGGPAVFHAALAPSLSGAAFITTRQETASASFRWLNRRQLFGIGRVAGPPHSLALSFDLYAAV
jgi:hypothetical protein